MFQPHIFWTDISERHLACFSEVPSSTSGTLCPLTVPYVGWPQTCLPHCFHSLPPISRDNQHASNSLFLALHSGTPQLGTPDAPLLPAPQFSPRSMTGYFASIKAYFSYCQKRVPPLFLPPKPSHMAYQVRHAHPPHLNLPLQ